MLRMEQSLIQLCFVAQQQQPFGIRIEPANGVNIFRETKFGERAVWRAVRRELRKDAVRFVKCDEHDARSFVIVLLIVISFHERNEIKIKITSTIKIKRFQRNASSRNDFISRQERRSAFSL